MIVGFAIPTNSLLSCSDFDARGDRITQGLSFECSRFEWNQFLANSLRINKSECPPPGVCTAKSKCTPTPRTRFEGVFNTNNLKYTRSCVRIHYECVLPTTAVAFLYRLGEENLPFGN